MESVFVADMILPLLLADLAPLFMASVGTGHAEDTTHFTWRYGEGVGLIFLCFGRLGGKVDVCLSRMDRVFFLPKTSVRLSKCFLRGVGERRRKRKHLESQLYMSKT